MRQIYSVWYAGKLLAHSKSKTWIVNHWDYLTAQGAKLGNKGITIKKGY